MPYEGILKPTIVQNIRSYDSHVVDFYMINRIGKSDDTFGASGRLGFKKLGLVVLNIFYVHSYLGEMIQFDQFDYC